jgi:hypothetical protein
MQIYLFTNFSSIFFTSFHNFLKASWKVKRYGKYGRKNGKDMKNTEKNSEKIWKIQKKIVKWYFFTNLTEKLGYHSNEIGKKWIFPFILFFFQKIEILLPNSYFSINANIGLYQMGHHDLQVCQVSRNYLSYFRSYGHFSAIFCIYVTFSVPYLNSTYFSSIISISFHYF